MKILRYSNKKTNLSYQQAAQSIIIENGGGGEVKVNSFGATAG